jgi:hypothetical protein
VARFPVHHGGFVHADAASSIGLPKPEIDPPRSQMIP